MRLTWRTWLSEVSAADRAAGKAPTFLVIGAAKTGSSSLFGYLNRDERIAMAPVKEPGFFAHERRYALGLELYRALWAAAEPNQPRGEMSTQYSSRELFPLVADRVAEHLPDVRLVYLVRDPIDRTYSHYAWRMRYGVTMTLEEAMEQTPDIVNASRYAHQLDAYRARFPADRFLVLDTAGLRSDSDAFVGRIQEFVGLERAAVSHEGEIVANKSDRRRRAMVTSDLRKAVPGLGLLSAVVPRPVKDRAHSLLLRTRIGQARVERHTPLPLSAPTRELLRATFAPDIARLADEYGVDVGAWCEDRGS